MTEGVSVLCEAIHQLCSKAALDWRVLSLVSQLAGWIHAGFSLCGLCVVCLSVCLSVCGHEWVWVCMCVCVSVCVFVHLYLSCVELVCVVCLCVCACACVGVRVFVRVCALVCWPSIQERFSKLQQTRVESFSKILCGTGRPLVPEDTENPRGRGTNVLTDQQSRLLTWYISAPLCAFETSFWVHGPLNHRWRLLTLKKITQYFFPFPSWFWEGWEPSEPDISHFTKIHLWIRPHFTGVFHARNNPARDVCGCISCVTGTQRQECGLVPSALTSQPQMSSASHSLIHTLICKEIPACGCLAVWNAGNAVPFIVVWGLEALPAWEGQWSWCCVPFPHKTLQRCSLCVGHVARFAWSCDHCLFCGQPLEWITTRMQLDPCVRASHPFTPFHTHTHAHTYTHRRGCSRMQSRFLTAVSVTSRAIDSNCQGRRCLFRLNSSCKDGAPCSKRQILNAYTEKCGCVVVFRWFEVGCTIWAKLVRAKSKHL